ncbi:hypothetical protein [Rheinheimera nanhaiensis]|uniref:Uncharacterized protein n=1 Tax=Rheinheimera nanhaiensis E407-8 TaxID=562729 RepID=I1DXW3_9GAMM|nr:hypothetical protein [Rheinheimera nanhaiensis]GAB58891.1 hypothetical protein RNAN_1879 [Rheinheimera nanhaiensis E407-8]
MRPLFFISLLLCSGYSNASDTLQQRLLQASSQPEQVITQLQALPANTLDSSDHLVLAEAQLRLRNKAGAMDAVNKALDSAADPYLKAHAFLLKAQIYGILYRDTVIAITMLEQAEVLLHQREDADSLSLYSDVLQSFAQAYNQLGNIPKAIPYARRSLELAMQQDAQAQLKARITLGRLTLQNNAFGEAYQHFHQALTLASSLQDDDALASIHLRLGMAYRKIEDHSRALHHLQQAKQRYKQLQRDASYAYTLIYIGETYLEQADTAAEAAQYLTEALALAKQLDDPLRVGIATLGLGRLAVLQQRPELARQHFDTAQQLFSQQNVQTYLQETLLALAELHLQAAEYAQTANLLQLLAADMPKAAVYLQLRFFELTARLAALQGDWQGAYTSLQQAGSLRLAQLDEQNIFQLDLINQGLEQAAAASQWQAELRQQQLQLSKQQRNISLLLATVSGLALALILLLFWARRRSARTMPPAQSPLPDWRNFCQQLQHKEHSISHLLAFSPQQSQQLKLRFGQQRITQVLHTLLPAPGAPAVLGWCLDQDVLWLALDQRHTDVTALQLKLARQLQQQLPGAEAAPILLSLQLPLQQLLSGPWPLAQLQNLPEAFWLTLALCQQQPANHGLWLARLSSSQTPACEWASSLVRQDLLNAFRLGQLQLYCNDNNLEPALADNLH